ncbi:hypothetical protein LshimejAT787_2400490 [Lyophyllum shimeji]|uniref:Uncharacterized protein n=1 Tax=Lyophyllum shimeji TaxID=47721 RepID=A0A9P3Q1G1_LYOSH|nr:hypothetical protein LshimejAT787_2400490 [Lyophyllum shimeji]
MRGFLLAFGLSTASVRASTTSQIVKLQSECGTLYTVVAGDGCWSIAGAAHITQAQLLALNPGLDCKTLPVGTGVCLGLPCGKTYQVASGDGCAKIESDQGVSDADLMSLNPGLACADIFPGQVLCIAAPSAPAPGDPVPTMPTPLPEPVVPSVPCKTEIAVSLGDICYDLATNNGLQLNQFTALNPKLNCSNLQPGDIACVLPACGEVYRVQNNDSCALIEQNYQLPSGKLVNLNPSLDCNALAPQQLLCVEDPPVTSTPQPSAPSFAPWAEYPVLSPGDTMPTSPLVDFLNTNDTRSSFIGQTMFQLDSQHREAFATVDINGDGHIDFSEMDTLLNVNPVLLRGLGAVDPSLAPDTITNTTMAGLDLNGDGVIDESEYLFGAWKVQKAIQESSGGALMRRDLPSVLPPGIAGLSAAQLSYALTQMQNKADADGSNLSKYLGVAFWDKSYTPEPKCSAVMYISSSCGALASNAAAKCSEGGNRVFENSCRDNIGAGAFQCNMNGCSSLCYKINTDGCDCDALKYTQENLVFYTDQPLGIQTTENNMVACRSKCSSDKSCVGFNVGSNIDGATVRCTLYSTMNSPKTLKYGTVSFKKVPSSNPSDTCPPLTEGYRLSGAQFEDAMKAGEQAAEDYSNLLARRDIVRRAPASFDPRTTFRTPRKNQLDTQLCASFTITTMVEASIMTKFKRTTPNELSPLWLAMCKAKSSSLQQTNNFRNIQSKLGSDFMATESCIPFSTKDSPNCGRNGCFSPTYGKLPYLTDSITFPDARSGGEGVKVWDRMKEHLSTIGPIYSGFQLTNGFMKYSLELAGHSEEEVYYDGHPSWPGTDCPYGGHAMTIIGYGTFKKGGKGKDRLFWIIQNSWGISKGKNGYVFVAAGSMGQAAETAYGVKVNEGIDDRGL